MAYGSIRPDHFIMGKIQIHTKLSEEQTAKLPEELCDWCDERQISCTFGYTKDKEYLCQYQANGCTPAYCKGIAAEFKYVIKVRFGCKISVLLEAW